MKTFVSALCAACLGLVCAISQVSAEVPPYIPVQGYLTDAQDTPRSGDIELRLRIYDGEDPAANVVFEETRTTSVQAGYFTVYLGDRTPLVPALFAMHRDLYLGVQVADDEELTPRAQLAMVPFAGFAQHCADAETVGGLSTTVLQQRVAGTCPDGQAVQSIAADGTVACAAIPAPGVPAITAGDGLSGGGGPGAVTLSIDTSGTQTRVTGTCTATQAIRSIAEDGTVTCSTVPQGTITGVTVGFGLTGGGTTGSVPLAVNLASFATAPQETFNFGNIGVTGSKQTLVSHAITAPRAGTLIAFGSGQLSSASYPVGIGIGLTMDASSTPDPAAVTHFISGPDTFSLQRSFPVAAGTHTVLLTGGLGGAEVQVGRARLTVVFIPH